MQGATEPFLEAAQKLSRCLNEYVKIVPDSQLLLVDIKPIIESLFTLHTEAKRTLAAFSKEGKRDGMNLYDSQSSSAFTNSVNNILGDVKGRFNIKDACERASAMPSDAKFFYLQPYGALVLADLLVAHGAPDEAIRVLAEWLNDWAIWQNTAAKPHDLPRWYEIRVASRLALFMKNLAGQTNIAYREFFHYYKTTFEDYVGNSLNPQRLDQYPDRCKFWNDASNASKSSAELLTERRIYYLLLANEDEELRTRISFLSEESNFEALERLFHRARFMASIPHECLPSELFLRPADRKGYVADHQITAGLLGLAVADRMATVARSRGDRERANDIRRIAEGELRHGWEELRPLVIHDRSRNREKHWSERIFAESNWESSASLATRALSQLRNSNY